MDTLRSGFRILAAALMNSEMVYSFSDGNGMVLLVGLGGRFGGGLRVRVSAGSKCPLCRLAGQTSQSKITHPAQG
jgi:hypothetical protein